MTTYSAHLRDSDRPFVPTPTNGGRGRRAPSGRWPGHARRSRGVKAWVAAHPNVKKAFDQDAATADGKTCSEALDILIDHYAAE